MSMWTDETATWADTAVTWDGTPLVRSYAENFVGDDGRVTVWHRIVDFAEGGSHRGSEQYYY
jgi:hypothetical protein